LLLNTQPFLVVKEQNGWTVRLGRAVSAPFWTKALAIREAERLCASLRSDGVAAEVVVAPEVEAFDEQTKGRRGTGSVRRAWR
jgi:hypothetical protein